MITNLALKNWITQHQPEPEDAPKHEAIRIAALMFAEVVLANTPESADQTAAIRAIRQAVLWAGEAIACKGR